MSHIQSLTDRLQRLQHEQAALHALSKTAFLASPPMPAGPPPMPQDPQAAAAQGGMPPQGPPGVDPNAGMPPQGGPPVDPATGMPAGGPPIDPTTGQPLPPMDPSQMGAPPVDPNAGAQPQVSPDTIEQIISLLEELSGKMQQLEQTVGAIAQAKDDHDKAMGDLSDRIDDLDKRLADVAHVGAAAAGSTTKPKSW